MSKRKRVRTIMYGDQLIYAAELDLLHTPALQRLYDLHQLGLTDRVFIDASHSRLQHVVGVLEQADKITNAIINNLQADPGRILEYGFAHEKTSAKDLAATVQTRRGVIRLIGLLHDLTHAPFGHTVEDEINLVVCKHDEPKRQADAFYRLLCQYIGWLARDAGQPLDRGRSKFTELIDFLDDPTVQPPTDWQAVAQLAVDMLTKFRANQVCLFWRLNVAEILSLLSELHAAMTALLHLELLHKLKPSPKHFPDEKGYEFQWTIEQILNACGRPLAERSRFVPCRDAYMLDVIGNTVCADLLDYAHRDSHFANIKLAYDTDRIAENFTLVAWDATDYRPEGDEKGDERRKTNARNPADPFATPCLRTAISLFTHKLRTDTLGELMNLLNVRFYLYERVIFNPTKCAADAMLGTGLQLLGWRSMLEGENNESELLPSCLRHVGDAVFLESVTAAGRMTVSLATESAAGLQGALKSLEGLPESLHAILGRDLAGRRCDPTCRSEAKTYALEEIQAGLLLLNRLRARHFYQPVFRMLPNAEHETLDVRREELAEKFADSQTRFDAERAIEKESGLPVGSIVIHCPEAEPARKVADALVVGPTPQGIDRVRKVRHIRGIDPKVYGMHQAATEAVSNMYGSMWRLVVYAAPQFLQRHAEIAKAAGKVIVTYLGKGSGEEWPNDPNLVHEFKIKSMERERSTTNDDSTASDLADVVTEVLREFDLGLRSSPGGAIDRDRLRNHLRKAFSAGEIAGAKKVSKVDPTHPIEFVRAITQTLNRRQGTAAFTVIKDWSEKNSGRIPDAKQADFIFKLKLAAKYHRADLVEFRLEDDLSGLLDACLEATLSDTEGSE